ncbi:hypothetical protein DL770_006288 [Monosporascus sp. CRB-9-2]|nr:hypothetical protein DL770_006288 [Monosporascus sp. CRB-9-2]
MANVVKELIGPLGVIFIINQVFEADTQLLNATGKRWYEGDLVRIEAVEISEKKPPVGFDDYFESEGFLPTSGCDPCPPSAFTMFKLPPVEKLPLAVRKNDLDDAKQFSYCVAEVHEGRLRVLFADGYLGTNIDDALDRNVLLKAPNDAAGGRELRRGAKLRGAKLRGTDGHPQPDIRLNSNFVDTFEKLLAESKWEGLVIQLKRQKFEDDELLREGFHKAVNKDEITFSIIDKLVKGLYSEPVIEDGVLYLQTWGVNIDYTAEKLISEGLVIIQGLFEGFFVDECRVDVFDATLIDKGLADVIAPHRILYPDAANSVKMLGKPSTAAVYQPWSLIQIVELIVFLPLNLIPYVGTPAFIIITGARLGTFAHYRWFKLRGLTRKERKAEIRSRMWEYTWFGTVAMLLELVPILSFLFLLTSTTGAALWAARLEEQKRRQVAVSGDAAPASSQGHEPDGPPPPYEDDPV